MGRPTLKVLSSSAQFDREVIGARIRDTIVAAKSRGCGWAACRRSGVGCTTAPRDPAQTTRVKPGLLYEKGEFRREMDCLMEGDEIEPLVPVDKPWVLSGKC